jgi:broad specificity phosphatase PhoE
MDLRPALALAAILLFAPLAGGADGADEQVWSLLREGGKVALMRHTVTDPGVGDPPGMRLDDCATQRNLTEEGRRHAKAIGEVLRARGVRFDRVVSSPMCRCLETARLAFGRVDEGQVTNARGTFDPAKQVREMRNLASEWKKGGNVVLVSHASTISAVTGINPEPGEILVISPQGDGNFQLRGRLRFSGQ